MKRQKRVIIAAALLVVLVLGSCFATYAVFDTANPLSAAVGLGKITLSDKPYAELSSKVVLSQPDYKLLTEYMENRGFTELETEQLGALRVFSDGEHKEYVMYSQNALFSKWRWE